MSNDEQSFEFTAKGLWGLFLNIFIAPFISKGTWSKQFYRDYSRQIGLKPTNSTDLKQSRKRILKFLKTKNGLNSEQLKYQNHLLNVTKSRALTETRIGAIWRFILCIVVPAILFVPTYYWLKNAPNGFYYKDPVKMTMALMGVYVFFFVGMIFVQMPLSKLLGLVVEKPLSKFYTVNTYVDGEYFDPHKLVERYHQKNR